MGKLNLKEVKKFNLGHTTNQELEFKTFQFQDYYISNPSYT